MTRLLGQYTKSCKLASRLCACIRRNCCPFKTGRAIKQTGAVKRKGKMTDGQD